MWHCVVMGYEGNEPCSNGNNHSLEMKLPRQVTKDYRLYNWVQHIGQNVKNDSQGQICIFLSSYDTIFTFHNLEEDYF